ncbi:MAG: hypothetical protein AB7P03_24070 [Kofleriaceae bacterium]
MLADPNATLAQKTGARDELRAPECDIEQLSEIELEVFDRLVHKMRRRPYEPGVHTAPSQLQLLLGCHIVEVERIEVELRAASDIDGRAYPPRYPPQPPCAKCSGKHLIDISEFSPDVRATLLEVVKEIRLAGERKEEEPEDPALEIAEGDGAGRPQASSGAEPTSSGSDAS